MAKRRGLPVTPDPNARFGVTDAPALLPGCDWITKSSVGPFIDTKVDLGKGVIDRGRIYLSFDTIKEMAQLLGIIESPYSRNQEAYEEEIRLKAYTKGYADGLKEGLGDDAARVADLLSASADHIRDLGSSDSAIAETEQIDHKVDARKPVERHGSGAIDGKTLRQVTRASDVSGRADVSADPVRQSVASL